MTLMSLALNLVANSKKRKRQGWMIVLDVSLFVRWVGHIPDHIIPYAITVPHTYHLIQTFLHHALQDEDKRTVEGMGAGPSPFVKKMKQPKHLDAALQPSSAADNRNVLPFPDAGEDAEAEPTLDDRIAAVKVRGIPYEKVSFFVRPNARPLMLYSN